MTLSQSITTVTLVLLLSCGASSENEVVKNVSSNKTTTTAKSCLEKYAMNPCELLDISMIAELSEVDAAIIEMEPPMERFKKSSMRVCKFSWNSGRKTMFKTSSMSMELDVDNDILVGSFKILDAPKSGVNPPYTEWFDKAYRHMTDEEEKDFKEKVKNKLEKSDEAKEQVELSKSLLDGVVELGKKDQYVDIEGMGDRATVNISSLSPDVYLNILNGNITFTVSVNVSNDKLENVELAKKIGAAILALCD